VEVRVVRPPENREDKLWGKIVDIFGDTVLTQLYEEGKPAVRRSFKRSQLRPGGEKTWKVTVVKAPDSGPAESPPAASE
jgi:hypothetical protein